MPGLERLLSPEEIADATGLHYQSVLDFIRRGDLRALKIGNRWKIRPEDYEAWLESKRTLPREPVQRSDRTARLEAVQARSTGPGSLARLAAIERTSR
jgi:excisionase family DNA binding protein